MESKSLLDNNQECFSEGKTLSSYSNKNNKRLSRNYYTYCCYYYYYGYGYGYC